MTQELTGSVGVPARAATVAFPWRLRRRPAAPPQATLVAPDTSPTSRALEAPDAATSYTVTGRVVLLIGAVLLGFIIQFAGVSQISAARDQQLALDDFRTQLANAVAPVGQLTTDDTLVPTGSPVAILAIPSLGLSQVVFEGTSGEVLTHGPGHRRDTPLPGQAGASVVYGRQASYGAPFGGIASLAPGASIRVTTGQGVSTYTVRDVRTAGDTLPAVLQPGAGRLTLVTASGIPFLPQGVVRVDADLTSPAQQTPNLVLPYAALGGSEHIMAGDASAWPLLILLLAVIVVVFRLFLLSHRYWGRWQTWIVALPLFLLFGLLAARQVAVLLPNLI